MASQGTGKHEEKTEQQSDRRHASCGGPDYTVHSPQYVPHFHHVGEIKLTSQYVLKAILNLYSGVDT